MTGESMRDQACSVLNGSYTSSSGTIYDVACGFDHYGGDLANAASETFVGCFDICDQTPGCDGFSYHASLLTCYMKSLPLTAGEPDVDSDFAQKASAQALISTISLTQISSTSSIPTLSSSSSYSASAQGPLLPSATAASSSDITASSAPTWTTSVLESSSMSAITAPSASATSGPASSGLSLDNKIGLGVGIGIGVPTLLVAILTYLKMKG